MRRPRGPARGRRRRAAALCCLLAGTACTPAFRYRPAVPTDPEAAARLGSVKFTSLWPAVQAVRRQGGLVGVPGARRSAPAATAAVLDALLLGEQRPLATPEAVLRTDKTGAWSRAVHKGAPPEVSLDQLALLVMQAFYGEGVSHVAVDAVHVTELGDDALGALISVLDKGEKFAESYFVILNFEQKHCLGGGVHAGWTAVAGAYDGVKQQVLVLDPASPKLQPFWVPLKVILEAMHAPDTVTGEPRGYLVVRLV